MTIWKHEQVNRMKKKSKVGWVLTLKAQMEKPIFKVL